MPTPAGDPTHALFVLHATSDTGFVRGYLVPALNLPPEQVLPATALRAMVARGP